MAAIESKPEVSVMNFDEHSEKLASLPKSAREIYSLLNTNGALKPREITSYTSLSNRTIRYGLKILVDSGFCRRVPDLQDLRTHFYAIN
ncbi:MAG: hypothetical protein KAT16_10955 [Candidatus Heimdallarchaeota archaeon]|nr:hypothetical protein [Candidatus Heimdallarchaeota archaeon]